MHKLAYYYRRTGSGEGVGVPKPSQFQKCLTFLIFGQNADDSLKSGREKTLYKVVKARLVGYFHWSTFVLSKRRIQVFCCGKATYPFCVSWNPWFGWYFKVARMQFLKKMFQSCSKKLSLPLFGLLQKYANSTINVSIFMQFCGVNRVVKQLYPQLKPQNVHTMYCVYFIHVNLAKFLRLRHSRQLSGTLRALT